jgi:membrane fusion protein (multidrug efflux system)
VPDRSNVMSKRFLIIGVLVLVLCAGLVAFNFIRSAAIANFFAHRGQPPVAVEAVPVQSSTWQPTVQAVGTARAQQGADLAVQAAGVVKSIDFTPDERVTAGQLLVQIDDSAEQADMASAQASINVDERKLDRLTALRKRGVASQSDWDDANAALQVAKSTYARAKAIAQLKAIKAPFDGVVGIARVNVGQYATAGTVVVTLQNLDAMKVDFTVPEDQAGDLHAGQVMHYGVTSDNMLFAGKLIGVDPKVDPQSRLVAAQGVLDNPGGRVTPGEFLRVAVDLSAEPDTLTLPQTAVISTLYGDYVYLVQSEKAKDGKSELIAHQTFVHVGRRDASRIEITDGVKEGDLVVSAGQNKLRNNAHVTVSNPAQVSEAGSAE